MKSRLVMKFRLELRSVERNYLLGDKLISRVPTHRKSLSSWVQRVQEVNEVTALAQRRAQRSWKTRYIRF